MKAGLFFGSFNPIHIGHLAIANYMVSFTDIDQIWFIVSPHNPLKNKSLLINPLDRYTMVKEAIQNDDRMMVSDIEFHLPKPSYTIDTLQVLHNQFPSHTFVIVMGYDGLESFNQWKMYRTLIEKYQRYIYPRGSHPKPVLSDENALLVEAPLMEISSTFIRQSIASGKDVRHFVPEKTWQYIQHNHLYKNPE